MIAYKPQQFNPNKHPLMPDGYPWCVSNLKDNEIPEENYIVISESDYELLINSFNLAPYYEAIAKKAIEDRIKYYQSLAPDLIVELYATNTYNGMTREQSDQMFEQLDDVLIRIKEGAFPTAIFRLQSKIPEGYVTQVMLDEWISKINAKLI